MSNIFEQFGSYMTDNISVAIFVAIIAGFAASFSPCCLSSIPLIIGYVSRHDKKDKKTPFLYSVFFVIGHIATFTILGIIAAFIGRIFLSVGKYYFLLLALVLLIASLQIIGVIKIKHKHFNVSKKIGGKFGAFLLGIVGGFFASPCSTPILIAILAYVAKSGEIIRSVIILFAYSIGHSMIILFSGIFSGTITSVINSNKTNIFGNVLRYIFALIMFLFSMYLFYIGF